LLSQFLLDSQITLPQIHIVTIQLSKLLTPLIKLEEEEEEAVAVVVVLAVVAADVDVDRQVALVKVNYIWITQAKTKVKQ
jgi:hypothetical protein